MRDLVRVTHMSSLIRWMLDERQRGSVARSFGFTPENVIGNIPLVVKTLEVFEQEISDEIDRRNPT